MRTISRTQDLDSPLRAEVLSVGRTPREVQNVEIEYNIVHRRANALVNGTKSNSGASVVVQLMVV